MRLSGARSYTIEVLKKLAGPENEELVMIAIEFMGTLGLPEGTATPSTESACSGNSRYTERLR